MVCQRLPVPQNVYALQRIHTIRHSRPLNLTITLLEPRICLRTHSSAAVHGRERQLEADKLPFTEDCPPLFIFALRYHSDNPGAKFSLAQLKHTAGKT